MDLIEMENVETTLENQMGEMVTGTNQLIERVYDTTGELVVVPDADAQKYNLVFFGIFCFLGLVLLLLNFAIPKKSYTFNTTIHSS